jgi:hypothetical protein
MHGQRTVPSPVATERERVMVTDIGKLLAEEAEAAEEHRDDDIPLVRSRRPAKEPAQVYSLRIPVEKLAELRRLAEERHLTPSALMRSWVLERLDRSRQARASSPSYARLCGTSWPKSGRPVRRDLSRHRLQVRPRAGRRRGDGWTRPARRRVRRGGAAGPAAGHRGPHRPGRAVPRGGPVRPAGRARRAGGHGRVNVHGAPSAPGLPRHR